jgi:O-antigen/teichoic acid export membrane protein
MFLDTDSGLPAALAGLAIAIVPLHAQAFLRSVFFARLRPDQVLWNDVLLSALRLTSLVLLAVSGALSTFSVMAAAGIAALASTVAGLLRAPEVVRTAHEPLHATCQEHWRYGRWLLATSGAYWASGQAPTLIGSAMMTPVAAAILKACQYLVAPLNVAFMGLDGVVAPRAARIRATAGPEATRRFLFLVAAGCAAAVVIYGLILLPSTAPLMRWLYKGQYGQYSFLVAIFLADSFLSGISRASSLSLKVAGQTRTIFYANLLGALAGVTALLSLVPLHGVLGAATAAPIASGVTMAGLLALQLRSPARPVPVDPSPVRVSEP